MKKRPVYVLVIIFILMIAGCGKSNSTEEELASMITSSGDGYTAIIWDENTYVPYCAIQRSDCRKQIGFVDGDQDDRVYEYKGYSAGEWIINMYVSGLMDSAMLYREINVVDIPDGLASEYEWNNLSTESVSAEPNTVNPDELADVFGISISLPENPNWIANSEYHLIDEDNLEITYHDSLTDSDCVILVAKNEALTLPDDEYEETLNENWEGRTINDQNIVVKVQRGKNDSKTVLATWEYNEYQFAIIGEIEREGDSGPIAKVALSIIHDLN